MRISTDNRHVWYVRSYYALLGGASGNRDKTEVNGDYLDVGKLWVRI